MATEPERGEAGREPAGDEDLVPEDDRVIGRAFRWSLAAAALAALIAALAFWGSREAPEAPAAVERGPIELPRQLDQSHAAMPAVRFSDVTRAAGIDFVHESGATGEKLLPETMGGGVAFLDHDADGDQDLLFVNSSRWSGDGPTMALYRNDARGRFTDVTAGSGLDVAFYGQGVAVGDYDNDGRPDVFLSALGPNRLYRNLGGGRFEDVTERAGVGGDADAWSTCAGFFDYDNDGDLDLFVCNYVVWSREIDMKLAFTLNGVDRAYGPPKQYEGTHSYLYRNDGGVFLDVSAEAGIQVDNPNTGRPMGKALGVTFADPDGDGDLDIFVANDTVQNFAFRNEGGGRFSELGSESGFAFDNDGNATGAMGIDAGDFDNRGALAIGIGNFANETTSFYVQQKDPWQFVDVANSHGIGSPSRLKLSFGLFFFDYDLDGRLDLLQANGHLEDEINEIQPSQTYRQATQLFWNCGRDGHGCYAAVPEGAVGDLSRPVVGRGAAYADIDADGDLDVVIAQTGGAPLLLRNDQALGHHWLRVRLAGRRSNRDAIGAVLELRTGEVVQRRCVMPTRSYLSQVELPVTFGLGGADRVDALRILWPDGSSQEAVPEGVDRAITIEQRV